MKLQIPKSWADVTVGQFVELNSIELDQHQTSFSVVLEKLSILTNTSSDDDLWEEMRVDDLRKIVSNCNFLLKNPSTTLRRKICNDKYILIDFMQMKLGEFIDVDFYQKDGQEKNMHKIFAILFRRYKVGEWGEIIMEPYSLINLEERSEEFINLPIEEVIGAINSFNEFKNNFLTAFQPLFEPNIDEDESIPLEDMDEISRQEYEEDLKQEEKNRKWSWTKFCFELSGRDFIKLEKVYDLGLVHTFNILAMKKDLNLE